MKSEVPSAAAASLDLDLSLAMDASLGTSIEDLMEKFWRYLSDIWPHTNKPKIIEYVNAFLKTKQGGVSQSSPSFGTQGGESEVEMSLNKREKEKAGEKAGAADSLKVGKESEAGGSSKDPSQQPGVIFKRFSSHMSSGPPPHQSKSNIPPPQSHLTQADTEIEKDKGKGIRMTEIVDAFDEDDAGSALRKRKAKGLLTQADLKRLKIDDVFYRKLTKDEKTELFVQTQDEHIEKLFKKERENDLKKWGIDISKFFELLPQKSLETANTIDSQIEFPISPNASSYSAYSPAVDETIEMESYEMRLKNFYAIYRKSANPYSLMKITNVKVNFDQAFEGISVHSYHAVRGSKSVVTIFCEADFPWMNPHDLIVLLNLWETKKVKGVFVENVQNFLANYFLELSCLDCEVARFLNVEAVAPDIEVNRQDFSNGMPKSFEIVYRPSWGFLVHALKDNVEVSMYFKCYNKECHSTTSLQKLMLSLRSNSISKPAEVDRVIRMVDWWVEVRKISMDVLPKVFPEMIQYHV